jgi:hypothetical protein
MPQFGQLNEGKAAKLIKVWLQEKRRVTVANWCLQDQDTQKQAIEVSTNGHRKENCGTNLASRSALQQ